MQSLRQGYSFTFKDHLYEKNNKYYKYNDKTLKFDENIIDIKCNESESENEEENNEKSKENEKYETNKLNDENETIEQTDINIKNLTDGDNNEIKICYGNQSEFCGSCKFGYYLSFLSES